MTQTATCVRNGKAQNRSRRSQRFAHLGGLTATNVLYLCVCVCVCVCLRDRERPGMSSAWACLCLSLDLGSLPVGASRFFFVGEAAAFLAGDGRAHTWTCVRAQMGEPLSGSWCDVPPQDGTGEGAEVEGREWGGGWSSSVASACSSSLAEDLFVAKAGQNHIARKFKILFIIFTWYSLFGSLLYFSESVILKL